MDDLLISSETRTYTVTVTADEDYLVSRSPRDVVEIGLHDYVGRHEHPVEISIEPLVNE